MAGTLCAVRAEGETDMIIDLAGKYAVITGSTSGIDFAIAHGLAESGAAVGHGRSQKCVDAAVQRLRAAKRG
jgi:NAD(P)-dependent dehydrogenase (short-subunit alcohol dehydrogenase family)